MELKLTAALLSAMLTLTGCVKQMVKEAADKRHDANELTHALPGKYRAEDASDLALIVTAVPVPMVGRSVYVARETIASDPHRMVLDQLWSVDLDAKGRIVQSVFLLKDPQRWKHILDQPELLQSLVPDDLTALAGCELLWHRTPTGFEGQSSLSKCHAGDDSAGRLLVASMDLRDQAVEVTQLQVLDDGRLPEQAPPAIWFARLTSPPTHSKPSGGAKVRDPQSR